MIQLVHIFKLVVHECRHDLALCGSARLRIGFATPPVCRSAPLLQRKQLQARKGVRVQGLGFRVEHYNLIASDRGWVG